MGAQNVQIDLNIRVVDQNSYGFSFAYGDGQAATPDNGPQGGQPIQVGSSAIARGLSVPVES